MYICFTLTKCYYKMQLTNITKRRVVRDKVFCKILQDKKLRDILILVTGLRDHSVCAFARRRSQKSVKEVDVYKAILEYTGWTDEDFFETTKTE